MNNQVAKKTTGSTVKGFIEDNKAEILKRIPKHLNAERMVSVLMGVANTPGLQKCSPMSLLQSLVQAGQLGLQVNQFNSCFLIPYGKECKLIIGYQGLIQLAKNSGELAAVHVEVVYEHDNFVRSETALEHSWEPFEDDRGKAVGAYCILELKNGSKQYETMSVKQIEKIRTASKGGKVWKDHWEEMAKKTVVRRALKKLSLNPEVIQTITESDNAEFDKGPVVRSVKLGADALLAEVSEEPEIEVDPATGEVIPDHVGT